MHREYRPDDMHHGENLAFGASAAVEAPDDRALVSFTALLGMLIAVDVLLSLLGWDRGRFPFGMSPVMIAAILGALYIVYGTLQSLLHRRIGADLALAQASLAALVLGQPFVAAEVVFIALLGEVLEAWTFARTRRALGRLVAQTPRTARVRRGGQEIEVPAHQVELGDRVVACPCGLVLATPAAMLASMAWLARHGVLIKGGSALESLAACDTFAFDKTGTLTKGTPQFTSLVALGGRDEESVLQLAASAESASRHPLAVVVVAEAVRRGLGL